jgi:hypothetical protein
VRIFAGKPQLAIPCEHVRVARLARSLVTRIRALTIEINDLTVEFTVASNSWRRPYWPSSASDP